MASPAQSEREQQILALWEGAAGLDRWARDDALLAGMGPPPAALGARNAALLGLRGALFPRPWPLHSRCPRCGEACEFEADATALAEQLETLAGAEPATRLDWSGGRITLRAPTADDLRQVARLPEVQSAVRALLARCVSGEIALDTLDDAALAELERRLERLDPAALVGFALRCPDCGEEWSAVVDVGNALWAELQRAAERALIAVDALARAYGWTEDEVLRLSPTRRAAYMQLVAGS